MFALILGHTSYVEVALAEAHLGKIERGEDLDVVVGDEIVRGVYRRWRRRRLANHCWYAGNVADGVAPELLANISPAAPADEIAKATKLV